MLWSEIVVSHFPHHVPLFGVSFESPFLGRHSTHILHPDRLLFLFGVDAIPLHVVFHVKVAGERLAAAQLANVTRYGYQLNIFPLCHFLGEKRSLNLLEGKSLTPFQGDVCYFFFKLAAPFEEISGAFTNFF